MFLNGHLAGYIDRDQGPDSLPLPAVTSGSALGNGADTVVLDVLVSAMGRLNFGCDWDEKGLTSGSVMLDGATMWLPRPTSWSL